MLGFAVVETQDDRVAVWLVSRTEPHRAGNTNAVVADLDEGDKLANLTANRLVLGDPDACPVTPHLDVLKVKSLLTATFELQDQIRHQWRSLRLPEAPVERSLDEGMVTALLGPLPNELSLRALATANGVGKAWTFWLETEQVRHRKVTRMEADGKAGDPDKAIWARSFAILPPGFSALPETAAADA